MTIPASQIVNVSPNVLSAGGTAIALIGLMLTQNTRVPINTVQSYPNQPAVSAALGASSVDNAAATIYFNGYAGATLRPANILVAQFPLTNVAAYVRSASLSGVSLATLQSFSGPISIVMDGYLRTAANVNLSSAVSFSGAATLIQTGLNTSLPTQATVTAAISGTVMTVTGTLTGALAVGQTVTGSNTPAGTIIVGGTLTAGTGTFTLNQSGGTVVSQTLTLTATALSVSFDSVTSAFVIQSGVSGTQSTSAYASGSLATSLALTQITGAVLSQGAVPTTPAVFMANVARLTQNWATFFWNFDPDGGVNGSNGNSTKLAFSAWAASTNNRYACLAGDADPTPTLSANAPNSLAQLVTTAGYGGTCPIYDPNIYPVAAFIAGAAGSIDFTQAAGRITFAFKSQSGLVPTVTDGVAAQNLLSNAYNFYGAYATAATQFQFFNPGSITGGFQWLDSYLNQIWLNANLQQSLLTFMNGVGSIPYNNAGYGSLANAMQSTINQGLAFGAYSAGVTLSSLQQAEVNAAAGGTNIAGTLSQQGWYLLIRDPGAVARQNRTSPTVIFWYVDGESVQSINMSSILA